MDNGIRKKFNTGEKVLLDKGKHNSGFVVVISQTNGKLFTEVKDVNSDRSWSVMTIRLTKNLKMKQTENFSRVGLKKDLLNTNENDIKVYGSRNFDNGWKVVLQGKSIGDSMILFSLLKNHLIESSITFKVGSSQRLELPNWEDSRKVMTIYCPNDMDILELCGEVYEKSKNYWCGNILQTFTGHKKYKKHVFYTKD